MPECGHGYVAQNGSHARMLTRQMAALRKAKAAEFDGLF